MTALTEMRPTTTSCYAKSVDSDVMIYSARRHCGGEKSRLGAPI